MTRETDSPFQASNEMNLDGDSAFISADQLGVAEAEYVSLFFQSYRASVSCVDHLPFIMSSTLACLTGTPRMETQPAWMTLP